MKTSERGAINILAVCAIVFGLGLAASAFLNFFQAQRAADERTQLKGQITDLTYQIAQDHKAAANPTASNTSSPTPTSSATSTPSPSVTPDASAPKSLSLKELGVSVAAADPVSDLIYAYMPSGGVPTIGFTTSSLQTKYPKCSASFLGLITKHPNGTKVKSIEHLIKTIGASSYYYVPASVECATDADGKSLRAKLMQAVSTTVIGSLN
ncbi:MAG: hypothetical protein ABIS59_01365 [Candidatus Saccharibacteria bacterium]